MPIFEYNCEECAKLHGLTQATFEMFFGRYVPEGEITITCPTCGAEAKRIPSTTQIKFKGSGFYVNDYKKEV